jgi:hypothetical protein
MLKLVSHGGYVRIWRLSFSKEERENQFLVVLYAK